VDNFYLKALYSKTLTLKIIKSQKMEQVCSVAAPPAVTPLNRTGNNICLKLTPQKFRPIISGQIEGERGGTARMGTGGEGKGRGRRRKG